MSSRQGFLISTTVMLVLMLYLKTVDPVPQWSFTSLEHLAFVLFTGRFLDGLLCVD